MRRLGALLVLSFCVFRANGMENAISFQIVPEEKCYSLGVPIVLDLSITNNGKSAMELDLGADGKEAFEIAIQDRGKETKVPRYTRSGLTVPHKLRIGAGSSYSPKLILDEFIRLASPGCYRVSIAIRSVGVGTPELKAETSIEIDLPLSDKLRNLWEEHQNLQTTNERRFLLKSFFALGRRPEFIKYQCILLSESKVLALQCLKNLIGGLLESGEDRALKAVMESAFDDKNAKTARMVALYCLSQMPVEWWDQSKNNMFGKFKDEIAKAKPIEDTD